MEEGKKRREKKVERTKTDPEIGESAGSKVKRGNKERNKFNRT